VSEPTTLAPSFLVAMPQLADPNFERCVVLLVHHDDEGTFGLVLNRDGDVLASSLCSALGVDWRGDPTVSVGVGGPVQPNTGWVLFSDDALADDEGVTSLCDGLHCAGSLDTLREVAGRVADRRRLFLGYAGWAPGQLEAELVQGAWLVAPASADIVFDVESEAMWERVLHSLGIDPATLVPTPGVH